MIGNTFDPAVDPTMSTFEAKLAKWVAHLPDYDDMVPIVDRLSQLEDIIRRKRREIEKADEAALAQSGKPRSNETRLARNEATSLLKDELAALEGEHSKLKWVFDFQKLTKDVVNIMIYYRQAHKVSTGY